MDAENFGWIGGRKLAHVGEVALCRPRGRHAIVAEGASRILDSSEVKGRRPFDGTWLEHGLQQIPSNHLILRVGDPTPIDQLADDVPHLPKRLRHYWVHAAMADQYRHAVLDGINLDAGRRREIG